MTAEIKSVALITGVSSGFGQALAERLVQDGWHVVGDARGRRRLAEAALDQLTAVLGAEQPAVRTYAFDPGDMATDLQQQAFPGQDVSDRPAPGTVVPALLRLLAADLPSDRYGAGDQPGSPG
jgi:NAD(P)-dependent dehydrogenase (short-subunit alcohol dehydrogenase family)